MAKQLVGLEQVPNVYITKIVLEDNSTKDFSMSVDLEVFDQIQSGNYIWSNNKMFRNFFRVALIITYDKQLSIMLKSGNLCPIPSEVTRSPHYNDNTTIKESKLNYEGFESSNFFPVK